MKQYNSLESVVFSDLISQGDTVLWGQAASEPVSVVKKLLDERSTIGKFNAFIGINSSGNSRSEHSDYIDFYSYCGTGFNRNIAIANNLDIYSSHYSKFPKLFSERKIPVDVLIVHVSYPDEEGRYSLGISQDYLSSALNYARTIIGVVNKKMPWVYGEKYLEKSNFDVLISIENDLIETPAKEANQIDIQIGNNVASLIENGSTLQLGIGSIPDMVLEQLHGHENLGIHTGTMGDKVADLMKLGVINNSKKTIDQGVSVSGMMMGSKSLYDYAAENPQIRLCSTDYTHNSEVLSKIEKFVAVNSAIEVDLTGQVNSEIAGGRYVGAVGGATDFLRAAAQSRGGVPVVAFPSLSSSTSRVVAKLDGPVSNARSDAGIFVTEYGVADLRGVSIKKRVQKMIDIAHPSVRERLESESIGLGLY